MKRTFAACAFCQNNEDMDIAESVLERKIEHAKRQRDAGKLLSEAEMQLKGLPLDRITKIKAFCLKHGQWSFDLYDPSLVLYMVVLDREFDSSRPK